MKFEQQSSSTEKKNLSELTLEHAQLKQKLEDIAKSLQRANSEVSDTLPARESRTQVWRDKETGMTVNELSLERARVEQQLHDVTRRMREAGADDLVV